MTGHGPVGVGVIGAGVISTQYLTDLVTFPDVGVKFVADVLEDRAAAQAEAFGVAGSGSVAQLLAHDDIEIVVNLTIPAAHVEVGLQVLDAGKHVWSEKPFATDTASGRTLLDAATAAGLRVGTAPDTFLGAGIQTTRRLIESGAIGQTKSALTMMQNPGPNSWHPNPDFLFQEGAGPLFDVGPYYVTALVQLFGPVRRVSATVSKAHERREIGSGPRAGEFFDVTVPTHVNALFEFENGQSSSSVFSFDSAVRRTHFEVLGTEGAVQMPDPNMFTGDILLFRPDSPDATTVSPVGADNGRGMGVVDLARSIRADVPERAPMEQAFHVLDVMESAIRAGESGQPVEIASTVTVGAALPEEWDPTARTL